MYKVTAIQLNTQSKVPAWNKLLSNWALDQIKLNFVKICFKQEIDIWTNRDFNQ